MRDVSRTRRFWSHNGSNNSRNRSRRRNDRWSPVLKKTKQRKGEVVHAKNDTNLVRVIGSRAGIERSACLRSGRKGTCSNQRSDFRSQRESQTRCFEANTPVPVRFFVDRTGRRQENQHTALLDEPDRRKRR